MLVLRIFLVIKVDTKCILAGLLNDEKLTTCEINKRDDGTKPFVYDFTMCNPPFFNTEVEAWSEKHASASNSANATERVYPGGEVYFVRKMIIESVKLKDKIQ